MTKNNQKKQRKDESPEDLIESLRKFATENAKYIKTKKSTLQILREIRNGKNR